MSKWKINLKSVVENFHQAIKAYDTENLIGIIFGSKELQIISNVFFTRNEDEEIESLTLELAAFLPPEIHCLGFITIKENGDIPIESLIKKISIIDGVNLHIEWSLEHLKLKNVTKLLESANFVENNESLSMLDGVFIKSSVLVSFQIQNEKNFETEVKEEISKKKSQVLEQLFIHEETKSTFSKTSKSSSLAKIQKADKKNYIVLKGKDNNEISNGTDVNNDPKLAKYNLNVLINVSLQLSDLEIFEYLCKQIEKLLDQIQILCLREKKLVPLTSNTFALSGWCTLVNVVSLDLEEEEDLKKEQRRHIHKLLNLSMDGPRIRPLQSIRFEENDSKLLVNPHEGIKYTPIGQVAIVKGRYHYHHYMQDNFDDSGWGCAYRSFQTIWSWFELQGYIDKPVPTHREIQQCLVNIGDKPAKFVGSRQWIGSMELSYCLETMLGIQSRILTTNSGKEVAEHCRALLYHFDNNGSPVMIGGGQLAHTILGVDYNTKTGESKFLVLDPHYTGDENLNFILKKGWCAWKPLSFWNPKSFYNLMLPINPKSEV